MPVDLVENGEFVNLKAERVILASLIQNPTEIDNMQPKLSKHDFAYTLHGNMFQVIIELSVIHKTLDHILVFEELKRRNSGMFANININDFMATISSGVALDFIREYVVIVKEYALRRAYKRFAKGLLTSVKNLSLPIDTLFNSLQQATLDLDNTNNDVNVNVNLAQRVKEKVIEYKQRTTTDDLLGFQTGFRSLDKLIVGFRAGNFVLIGARPAVGKTAIAMNIALNMNLQKKRKIGFFSLEMSADSLVDRTLSYLTLISHHDIQRKSKFESFECDKLDRAVMKLNKDFWIHDKANLDIDSICAEGRKLIKVYGVEIIFIGYIGLISTMNQRHLPRFEQVTKISSMLKDFARVMQVPVVALSQLRRDAQDKEPTLADLRESGALEQDADIVILMHRQKQQEQSTNAYDKASMVRTFIKVAKNRNGVIGTTYLDLDVNSLRWIDKNNQF